MRALLRIAQPIGCRVQEGVQGLLHATSYHPVEVILDPLVVDRDDIVSGLGVVSFMAAPSLRLLWLRLATSSSARFGAASPYLFV
jgi:hypothetical protein